VICGDVLRLSFVFCFAGECLLFLKWVLMLDWSGEGKHTSHAHLEDDGEKFWRSPKMNGEMLTYLHSKAGKSASNGGPRSTGRIAGYSGERRLVSPIVLVNILYIVPLLSCLRQFQRVIKDVYIIPRSSWWECTLMVQTHRLLTGAPSDTIR
jgi:hypothetical protein